MKKLMILSVMAFVLGSPAAFADDHGERGGKGKLFQKSDLDKDGLISKGEFEAHHQKKMEEWFGRLDANGDGNVSPDEAKAGRKKMREGLKERREKRQENRNSSDSSVE